MERMKGQGLRLRRLAGPRAGQSIPPSNGWNRQASTMPVPLDKAYPRILARRKPGIFPGNFPFIEMDMRDGQTYSSGRVRNPPPFAPIYPSAPLVLVLPHPFPSLLPSLFPTSQTPSWTAAPWTPQEDRQWHSGVLLRLQARRARHPEEPLRGHRATPPQNPWARA